MTLTWKLRTNRAALVEAHQNNDTPAATVAALISSIGYDAAVEIVASMVNAKGEWDKRISRVNRTWAAAQDAPNSETLDDMCVWYCAEIHPAHMDQIADAMRNAERPTEANESETAEEPETAKEKADRENREHCKRIAEELEEYAEGLVYTCPECGSICTIEEDENDDGETIYKTSCGCCLEDEPDEQLSVLDFIRDAYDIEYRVGSDREYRSVKIMVACGGPNIYIDTARRLVTLHWWTDYAEYPISSTACDALDEYMEEYWRCM
jgi:hypothetical protein